MSAAAPSVAEKTSLVFNYRRLVDVAVFIFIACGVIGFIEPSPYDFASIVAMLLWFCGGFSVHRSFLIFASLIVLYTFAGFAALIPYWDNPDSALYQYQSAYLVVTALFYALYMGNDTQRRVELCLKAYVMGAVVGAACGIAGYLNVAGLGEGVFLHAGRASGTFKDPNVLGSFLVLPIVYLAQSLMLGTARNAIVTGFLLLVCFLGMFLSFSRGSYGATLIAFILLTSAVFVSTPNSATRRRIVIATLATVALAAVIVAALLSIPETREFFQQRTAVTQDYDEGSTGRFGNQLRAIPMLLDRFMGFGPLRFRLNFGLEPHNSYVGAFANAGWIGGLLFLLIVGVTAYVGLRLMFTSSPFQRQAQVAASALMALFAQGLQIDIDHWRFVFFMLGAVWGLEAGRQRWLAQPRLRLNPPSRPAEEASFRFEPADAPSPRRDSGPYGCASP